MNDRYRAMSDEEAKQAIRNCINKALIENAPVQSIHEALKSELGLTAVALTFHPKPVNGRIQYYGSFRPMFMFMAWGPTGNTISG